MKRRKICVLLQVGQDKIDVFSDVLDEISYFTSLYSCEQLCSGNAYEHALDTREYIPLPLPEIPEGQSDSAVFHSALPVFHACLQNGSHCVLEADVAGNAGVLQGLVVIADFLGCDYLSALSSRLLQLHSLNLQEAWLHVMISEVRLQHLLWAANDIQVENFIKTGAMHAMTDVDATPKGWWVTKPCFHVNGMYRAARHKFASMDLQKAQLCPFLRDNLHSLFPFNIFTLVPSGNTVAVLGFVVGALATKAEMDYSSKNTTITVACIGNNWDEYAFLLFLQNIVEMDDTKNHMFVNNEGILIHGMRGVRMFSLLLLRRAYANIWDALLDVPVDCDRVGFDGSQLHFLPCARHAFLYGVNIHRADVDPDLQRQIMLQRKLQGFGYALPNSVRVGPSWGGMPAMYNLESNPRRYIHPHCPCDVGVNEFVSTCATESNDEDVGDFSDTELFEEDGMPTSLGLHIKRQLHKVSRLRANDFNSMFLGMCLDGVFMQTHEWSEVQLRQPKKVVKHPLTNRTLYIARVNCCHCKQVHVYFTAFEPREQTRWIRRAKASRFFHAPTLSMLEDAESKHITTHITF